MTSVFEGTQQGPPLNPLLNAGMTKLSNEQAITFTQYTRHVLPLDGYVFWLRTQATTVSGSLHVSMTVRQSEDETATINRVVFSTSKQVQQFNRISSDTLWVGEWQELKFAFNSTSAVYEAAGVYHYAGDAVYPALQSQLVDTGAQLSDQTLIVSNSLPLWLALQQYSPIWLLPDNPGITLYPSFLVPQNLQPPYGTVHIEPSATVSLQPTPALLAHSFTTGTYHGTVGSHPTLLLRGADHYQLAKDHVRITLYGLTNDRALDFIDLVNAYSFDQDTMGIMGASPMRDDKRIQSELGVIAMKKTVEFDVSYYQARVNDVARQLIEQVTVSYFDNPLF